MRKILALLIVLAVAAPGFGFLCHCCPAYAAEGSSSPAVISQAHCSCCPEAIEASKNQPATRATGEFSPLSFFTRLFTLSFIVLNGAVEPFQVSTHGIDSSPPGRTSDTPLYLALEVLRL